MAITSIFKNNINRLLTPVGLKLETTRLDRAESARLEKLNRRGYFDAPAFPLPDCVRHSKWQEVIALVQGFQHELQRLRDASSNQVGFSNSNGFYASPDSDVLYAMLRHYAPATYLEIGSGNSTRIARQAIIDGNLSTRVISIDPFPRAEIEGCCDTLHEQPVEHFSPSELSGMLSPGDVLFIDSSHISLIGSDCTFEFLQLLPRLAKGVLVHVHDVSLPWDYPIDWFRREPAARSWNEQYLLQAMLMRESCLEVLWPGYYVQKNQSDQMDRWFPMRGNRDATAFWFMI